MNPYMMSVSPRPGKTQNVAYTGTVGSLTVTAAGTSGNPDMSGGLWIVCTTAAFVSVGGTATATTDMYLPADTPVVLGGGPGSVVSAIQSTTGGTLFVTPLA